MSEPITREEQDDLRDKLFERLCDIGYEKGFETIEMTQTASNQNTDRMEWTIKVVFKRGVKNNA